MQCLRCLRQKLNQHTVILVNTSKIHYTHNIFIMKYIYREIVG